MKVLFVHERLGAFGGAETNILATADALADNGHAVALLHGASTGRQEAAWRRVFGHCYGFAAATGVAALDAALVEFAPDVIYLHKLADLTLLAALAECAVPVVRMVHDHDLTCMRSYSYNPLTRNICERAASAWCVFPCGASLARNAGPGLPFKWISYTDKLSELALNRKFAGLVVASRYMKDGLLRNGFAPGRIAIHAPVPPATEEPVRSTFGPRNLIVYAGQIVRGKGVDILLESLARVTQPFEAVLLGDGNHRAECERLCRRLGLQDRVTFTGFVNQEEIRRHYREATVAVISSVWPEPFGAVGLEAMRCGLPVVGFDAGGIREWLFDGETGYLVPWMDRAQYADRLDRLLREKSLARFMGECGRALAAERFSFAGYLQGLESLLLETAGLRAGLIPA
jgi:glycosyltransferase involved in cell wall biosynthesis